MKLKLQCRDLRTVSVLTALMLPSALTQSDQVTKLEIFDERYHGVPQPSSDQAQIIYFRPALEKAPEAVGVNVYIDGHFHTVLLPGGYTSFCLSPGQHIFSALQNDAPLFRGKTVVQYQIHLEGGKTYFVQTSEDGTGAPVTVTREVAEQLLSATREQLNVIVHAGTSACTLTPLKSLELSLTPSSEWQDSHTSVSVNNYPTLT